MKRPTKIIIPLLLLVIVAAVGFSYYSKAKKDKVEYETATVARGDLAQSVEVTGNVESSQALSMYFEIVVSLAKVLVKEGDRVKEGDLLASLRLSELEATVAQARANLNQKIAGATRDQIAASRAAADAAKAALDQARIDTANATATAESAVETARNNLRQAEGGENSAIINNAYQNAVALLQATLPVLDDALTQADNILGIDNSAANDDFDEYLSVLDSTKLIVAQSAYTQTREARNRARLEVQPLTASSAHSIVDNAIIVSEDALVKMNQLLSAVHDVLVVTPPVGTLTQVSLDAKKTAIQTARTSVSTKYTSIVSQRQAIVEARNSYRTYSITYQKALRDLDDARASGATTVAAKEAAYNQALANWRALANPPRQVDLAPLRAALAQAEASRDKAILRAPIDGIITKVHRKVGELVSQTEPAIEMVSPYYEVKVDVPETDVSKLSVGDSAEITLDAFGSDTQFSGKIISIDPASTEIQDVVYYRVRIALDKSDKDARPGMTANVTIVTERRSGALFIPFRAVRSNGSRYVRVLENGLVREVPITLGMRADEGKVEVLEGLSEGQRVVVSVRK